MYYLSDSHILIFLLQVFVLLIFARGLGELFRKFNQPALIGEIIAGIILGPTIFGRFIPELSGIVFPIDDIQKNMLETVAWMGMLFMLLETGMEMDFSVAWRQGPKALTIAVADIFIPLAFAFVPAYFIPDQYLVDPNRRIIFALFMGTVMSISSLPVAARILHDLNLRKTDMGLLILSALAVNEVAGWVLFSIIVGLFLQSTVNFGSIFGIFFVAIGFAVIALSAGRWISTRSLEKLKKFKMGEPATSLTFAVLLGLLFGLITQKIGIQAFFGFFIAGIVIGEAKNLSEETRQVMSQMVYSIFVPLFFANIGLKIDFIAHFNWFLVLFVLVVGALGRYLGALAGVRLTNVPALNRNLISLAHVQGGMVEIVVSLIALQSGLITEELFEAIVFGGIFSALLIAPIMRAVMQRRKDIRLAKYLFPCGVIQNLKARSREEAIYELCHAVSGKLNGVLKNKCVASIALKREDNLGTALGEMIAVPHVRLEGLRSPLLAMGYSKEGIDWNAPDGEAVKYIFFVLSPEGTHDIHVQILSTIAKAMVKQPNREAIDQSEDNHSLFEALKKIFSSVNLKKAEFR